MSEQLLSCPFCGSSDIDESYMRGYLSSDMAQPVIAAGCNRCAANGPMVSVPDHSAGYKEAAEKWNTRQPAQSAECDGCVSLRKEVSNLQGEKNRLELELYQLRADIDEYSTKLDECATEINRLLAALHQSTDDLMAQDRIIEQQKIELGAASATIQFLQKQMGYGDE